MIWTAYIYGGSLPLIEYASDLYAWEDVPNMIAFVVVTLPDGSFRRLQGFDQYMIDGDRYGVRNEPQNADIYEGQQSAVWIFQDGAEATDAARDSDPWIGGVMLPNGEAESVGLI